MALCLLHGNLQVPYWKLFGLLTQTSIFSTSFQMSHNRRKAFFRDCCPRSTSFNDTAIVRNFYPKKFWSRQTFHLLILCNCCCLLLFTIKLLILTVRLFWGSDFSRKCNTRGENKPGSSSGCSCLQRFTEPWHYSQDCPWKWQVHSFV